MRRLTSIWETRSALNNDLTNVFEMDSKYELSAEEWVALVGKFGSSRIRYNNEGQFKARFFTILIEAVEKLRAKLRINTMLRELNEEVALTGSIIVNNQATNPDTEPSTDDFEPLPYINKQDMLKEKSGVVTGLYNWKHSIGGQAYNEFLDMFKPLFVTLIDEEISIYET